MVSAGDYAYYDHSKVPGQRPLKDQMRQVYELTSNGPYMIMGVEKDGTSLIRIPVVRQGLLGKIDWWVYTSCLTLCEDRRLKTISRRRTEW